MPDVEGCNPGRRATVTLTVGEQDTALAMGSGDVPVLASPRVAGLAEQAVVAAIGDCLPDGKTSVGAWLELEHLSPSPVGATVVAEAVLVGVHGRRLEFSVSVREGDEEIAHVRHRRVLVSRSRFTTQTGGVATGAAGPGGDSAEGTTRPAARETRTGDVR